MSISFDIETVFGHDPNFQTIMTNMLQTAFDISFDGVMITEAGPGYPIVYVNQALCEMTGYSPRDFHGQSPAMLQGDKSDQRLLAQLKEQIEKGEIFHGKTVNYRKDGTEFIMEWKIVPIIDKFEAISHYLAIQRELKDEERIFNPLDSQLPFDFR